MRLNLDIIIFSVGIHTNTNLLKKYVKTHPEAQERLDLHIQGKLEANSREIEQIKGYGDKLKGYIDKIKYDAEEKRKYKNCKKYGKINKVEDLKF